MAVKVINENHNISPSIFNPACPNASCNNGWCGDGMCLNYACPNGGCADGACSNWVCDFMCGSAELLRKYPDVCDPSLLCASR